MRRTLLLLPVLAALSCGTDASAPLAPESPQVAAVMGAAAPVSAIRGQLFHRSAAAFTQYRFSVTGAGGSITKIIRPRGGAAVTSEIPVLSACAWEGAAGRSVRMITRDYADVGDTRTDDFWILETRGERGPEFRIAELILRDPPALGVDPCDPYQLVYPDWRPVSGAVRLGL